MINLHVTTKFNRIPQIQASIRPSLSAVVRRTAHDIEGEVKKEMRGSKSGRQYGTHQASAPGQAPAVDTGLLINSIQVVNVSDLTSTVGTNVEYAMGLEFGTTRVAPRPVWIPVTEKMRKTFVDAVMFVLRQIK